MIVQGGKPPKLQTRWRGAYKVSQQAGRASYLVVNLGGGGSPLYRGLRVPLNTHEDALKRFVQRTVYLADREVMEFLPRYLDSAKAFVENKPVLKDG
ncbi:hypothetical protein V8C40DRAFT_229276 [Trichoderma camerunense]